MEYPENRQTRTPSVMIPRIKNLETLEDYRLKVTFDDGVRVIYDLKDDIDAIDDFKVLLTERHLFENAQLDSSRTCVFWSDRIDLASDSILEYGTRC